MKNVIITRNAFKNYKSLKVFQGENINRNIKEIAYTLIENCKNMEKLSIYDDFSEEEIIKFLLYVGFAFRLHNNHIPLTVYLFRIKVRILLIKSEINSGDKILFEIYKSGHDPELVLSTNDLDTFLNELVSLYFQKS